MPDNIKTKYIMSDACVRVFTITTRNSDCIESACLHFQIMAYLAQCNELVVVYNL